MRPTTAALLLGVALAWGVAGVALLARRGRRLPGGLAVATGVTVAAGTAVATHDGARAAETLFTAAGLLLGPLAFAAHPGRGPRGPWHTAGIALLLGSGLVGTAAAWWGSDPVRTATALVTTVVLGAHTWWRLERSTGEDRQAIAWACVGVATASAVLFVVAFVVPESGTVGEFAAWSAVCLVPASLVIGTRPRRVLDPRLVTVGGVVLGGAVLTTLSVYVLLASLLEVVAGPPSSGALAVVAVLAATTFHPVRVRLRGVVDELLFGSRPDPLGAAAEVATGVDRDPQAAVEAVRGALVLPYVALEADGRPVAVSGEPGTPTRRLPLPGGEGQLVVGLRPGDLALPDDDERVLRLVTPLLALMLRAHALNESLSESRAQARALLEEERRRLRRDLHDGLGPQLSGIAFTADAVANLVDEDPAAARDLVLRLRADAADAIADVRRLVYGMRPPALDELGLVGALEQRSRGLASPSGGALSVRVSADAPLPPLPAAVEVAAYRIASEALVNASRHSSGSSATVRLEVVDGALRVLVEDSGDAGRPWAAGVGVQSMRERAAETGGTLTCGPTPDGGRVEAVLPLAP